MAEAAGTFLPIEFEEGINYLMRHGEVEMDADAGREPRYRLTAEGHYAEEEARLTIWHRWWRDLKREFGTRLFWLLVGAALVIVQRLIWP